MMPMRRCPASNEELGDLGAGFVFCWDHGAVVGGAAAVEHHDRDAVGVGYVDFLGTHQAEDQPVGSSVQDRLNGLLSPFRVASGLGDQHGVVTLLGNIECAADHGRGVSGDADLVGDEADDFGLAEAKAARGRVGPVVQLGGGGADPCGELLRQPGAGPVVEDQTDRCLRHPGSFGDVGQGDAVRHRGFLIAWVRLILPLSCSAYPGLVPDTMR